MGLVTKLVEPLAGEDRLPVHQFMACLAEAKRGAPGVNVTTIGAFFELTPGEITSLQEFYDNFNGSQFTREQIHDVLMMGEYGIYTVQNVKNRLNLT